MHYSDNMEGNPGNGAVSANSSSDFVSRDPRSPGNEGVRTDILMSPGAKAVQV